MVLFCLFLSACLCLSTQNVCGAEQGVCECASGCIVLVHGQIERAANVSACSAYCTFRFTYNGRKRVKIVIFLRLIYPWITLNLCFAAFHDFHAIQHGPHYCQRRLFSPYSHPVPCERTHNKNNYFFLSPFLNSHKDLF